jgi:hypothetical protein
MKTEMLTAFIYLKDTNFVLSGFAILAKHALLNNMVV